MGVDAFGVTGVYLTEQHLRLGRTYKLLKGFEQQTLELPKQPTAANKQALQYLMQSTVETVQKTLGNGNV